MILFRAERKSNNKNIEGNYIRTSFNVHVIIDDHNIDEFWESSNYLGFKCCSMEIKPETLQVKIGCSGWIKVGELENFLTCHSQQFKDNCSVVK